MNTNENKNAKRDRRHWYDHEKQEIIGKYAAGELQKIRGKKDTFLDPKSGRELTLTAIDNWKKQFKKLGIALSYQTRKSEVTPKARELRSEFNLPVPHKDEVSMQTLLVKTLLENERLREVLASLNEGNQYRRKTDTLPKDKGQELSM